MKTRTRLAVGFSLVVFSVLLTATVSFRIYNRIHGQSLELREQIRPDVSTLLELYGTLVELDRSAIAYALHSREEDKARTQALAQNLVATAKRHRDRKNHFGTTQEALAQNVVDTAIQYTDLIATIMA
jgi:hypothetical protein